MGIFANFRLRRAVMTDVLVNGVMTQKAVPEYVQLGNMKEGRVLLLAGEKHIPTRNDRFGETSQEVYIEAERGRRIKFFSMDPVVIEQIQALKHNQLVNVVGVQAKNSGSFRIETLEVVQLPTTSVAAAPAV